MARERARGYGVFEKVMRSETVPDDIDAISLRVHQIAATAGALAVAAVGLEEHGESLSDALYLIEECLLDVETRMEGLRRGAGPDGRARRRKASDRQGERPRQGRHPT
jgi:hypothetical protein